MSVTVIRRSSWAVLSVLSLVLACGHVLVFGQDIGAGDTSLPDLPHKDFSGAKPCPVVRVCRGDTVIVKVGDEAKRIGLIGVEVPGLPDPAGLSAERFLENLLAGESVYVEFADNNPTPDRFGCLPAYLYRAPDGLFVNLELIRQGYAAVPEESSFEQRSIFERFQQLARDAQKGRWAPDQPTASPAPGKSPPPVSLPGATTAPTPAAQAGSGAAAAAADTIGYITAKGAKYHREGCRHARKSGQPISLAEARKRGLTPCAQCKPPD